MEGIDKICCLDGNNSALETAALMNNNNQWMNNPFMYLIWLAFFGKNGFGGNGNCDAMQLSELMSRINQVQTQMSDSFNAQNTNNIIASNHDAINTGFAGVQAGIANSINNDTINAKDLQSTLQNCCCQNKMETMKAGYENQISNLNQTNTIVSNINDTKNAITNGFTQIGYATAQQTCDLKTNQNENTQRIIDTMTTHWHNDTARALQDAKFEISQLKQNQLLISSLGGGCACNA